MAIKIDSKKTPIFNGLSDEEKDIVRAAWKRLQATNKLEGCILAMKSAEKLIEFMAVAYVPKKGK